jgi:ANTAR domain
VDEPAALLAQLTRQLANTSSSAPLPMRLCRAFSATLATRGGSITMGFNAAERMTLCTTDPRAELVESAQDVSREGPSFDAFRTGVAVGGLSQAEQGQRWPMLTEMLRASSSEVALHAFPLRPEDAVVGVVLVHQHLGDQIAVDEEQAQFLANAVGVAILGDLGTHSVTEESWSLRDRVDQATGMVIAQLRINASDALAVLRAHAFAHGSTLAEVSALVLARELDFSDTDGRAGKAEER